MSEALDRLAEAAGIEPSFTDYFGNERRVSDATKRALLEAMGAGDGEPADDPAAGATLLTQGEALDRSATPEAIFLEDGTAFAGDARELPLGYHRAIRGDGSARPLIVVPRACYLPDGVEEGGMLALATQLYGLRSERNWGAGDFGDLADVARAAGAIGAGAIALNPLHELHPSNPWACSPYAPSSRRFLNTFYLDVERIPDLERAPQARALIERPAFRQRLRALRASDLIDYAGVTAAKREVLEAVFAAFRTNSLERPGDRRAEAFRGFVRRAGAPLERLARYEALAEHFRAADPSSYGWQQWPAAYRFPDTLEVEAFARRHRDRIDFYAYLQFLADEQLASAARTARACGVGLYRDLAVGVELNGADAWSDQSAILAGASLGAPPDHLNARGQNWGLPPLSPVALQRQAYQPFAALLRANMQHASVLRIDHVMALKRGFWIPRGASALEGAYVRYPFEAMLGILALESVRQRCIVVGEDLGTVPAGFRERLREARALSSRLVYFERGFADGVFAPPQSYPELAAASVGTHDLPPLAGWWTAADLTLRRDIGSIAGDDAAREAWEERRYARYMLVDALERAGAADAQLASQLREDAGRGGTLERYDGLFAAVHRFLAATPSRIKVVAVEDVLGETDAVNVPGTVDQHPNWRRKHPATVEELSRSARFGELKTIFHRQPPEEQSERHA